MKVLQLDSEFRARYNIYDEQNKDLVVLISGYNAPMRYFNPSVRHLRDRGFAVMTIEYDSVVLKSGDPDKLLLLINKLTVLVNDLTKDYRQIIFAGPSMGAYIAFNIMQALKIPSRAIFGAAGVTASRAVFHNAIFRRLRKKFEENGYDEAKLFNVWEKIETPQRRKMRQDAPFLVYITRADRIADYKTAKSTLSYWKDVGYPVDLKIVSLPGHMALSLWFMRNAGKLIIRNREVKHMNEAR